MSTVQTTGDAGVPADTLALRLAIVRFVKGLSAEEAARLIGVSGQTWRNWEEGKSGADKPWMLSHIARTFGVDEAWLRDGGPLGPSDGGGGGGGMPTDLYSYFAPTAA